MKQIAVGFASLALALGSGAFAQPLRDPFARPPMPALAALAAPADAVLAEGAPPAPALQLRAVMVSSGRSLANINGHILAVGERFGDYQLIKVEEHGVTLARRGVRSVLALDEARRK